ncbi:hypothetical protein EZY14_007370 [Kordia sp. TARA_039_SRF]|nr:hypothetical protein EZY14_007370 [Kordia sp. TARA_039_SRF]
MNTSKKTSFVLKLKEIISSESSTLKAYVANEALIFSEDINDNEVAFFFEGLLKHGCVSGWISSLCFYSQTHRFYDQYYDYIENLRYDYEDSIGQPLAIRGDLKNFMTWFAFEETAYQLALELGLEI